MKKPFGRRPNRLLRRHKAARCQSGLVRLRAASLLAAIGYISTGALQPTRTTSLRRRRGGAPGGGTDLNVPFIYLLCSRQAIGRQHMSLLAHATHITAGGASSLSMANSACNRGLVTKRQTDCVGSQLMFRWLPVLVRCPHPQFLTNARCSASPEVHWSVTWCWLPMPILRVVYEAQHVELLTAVNSSC